jgi:hypothetical protein
MLISLRMGWFLQSTVRISTKSDIDLTLPQQASDRNSRAVFALSARAQQTVA